MPSVAALSVAAPALSEAASAFSERGSGFAASTAEGFSDVAGGTGGCSFAGVPSLFAAGRLFFGFAFGIASGACPTRCAGPAVILPPSPIKTCVPPSPSSDEPIVTQPLRRHTAVRFSHASAKDLPPGNFPCLMAAMSFLCPDATRSSFRACLAAPAMDSNCFLFSAASSAEMPPCSAT